MWAPTIILVNGFAVKTLNTTYFGTLNNDIVTELCIAEWNENTTNEILEINKAFNLIFANWLLFPLPYFVPSSKWKAKKQQRIKHFS